MNKALQQFWSAIEKWLPDTSHSIGKWVLLRMALLLTSLGTLFILLAIYLLDESFDAVDQKEYKNDALRVSAVLLQEGEALAAQLYDYANWIDAVDFIRGKKADFVSSNFTFDSLNSLQIAAMVVTKLDATPIIKLSTTKDKLSDMPNDMLTELNPYITHISQLAIKERTSTLLWLNNKPYLIAAAPITETIRQIPPTGYMFMLRRLDDRNLKEMQTLTMVTFTIQHTVAKSKQVFIINKRKHNSSNQWAVSLSPRNLPIQIYVGGPTRLYDERRLAYLAVAISSITLIIFALAGIYQILNLRLLQRLKDFSQLADNHRISRNPNIRWPIHGNDELDNLSKSLNDLMGEVSARHQDMSFLAEHDPLTGIGNRRKLHNRLEALQNRSRRQISQPSSLLLLDLDGFKSVNDGLGHAMGDKVLQMIANRLLTHTRNYDTVARINGDEEIVLSGNQTVTRLGGDEFAMLLEDTASAKALPYAVRLLNKLTQPMEIDGQQLTIRSSIGIAPIEPSLSKEEIVRNADIAMYEAKRRGKNQVALFDNSLLDKASRQLNLEQALKRALDNRALEVWFQPIIAPDAGCMVGMEALCRWQLDGTYIPAEEFISIAETTGMIVPLGQFVFDQVGASLKTLRVEHPDLQCSVNLSVRQFRETDLVTEINNCLHKYQLPANALKLELTESLIAEYEGEILPTMLKLVEMGCSFYLDDFGTGYSSLDRLRRLPFEVLKIDRSFVSPLSKGDDVMARNIINIGRELGMNLIAEGVETEEELSRLLALGCKQFQGYYFAKPMHLNGLRSWLIAYEKSAKKKAKQMTKKPAKTRASKT